MVDNAWPEQSRSVQSKRMTCKIGEAFLAFLATSWLGLLLGISFLATPVKFRAPLLDLPVALDVGRVTFALFNKIELGLCLVLVLYMLFLRTGAVRAFAAAFVVAIVLVETFWLLPILDARVSEIIAGVTISATDHHLWYVVGEVVKAVLLLGLAVDALHRLARPPVPERSS